MQSLVILAGFLSLTPAQELAVTFWGITPAVKDRAALVEFKPTHKKAVVLVHGLLPRPLHPELAEVPEPHNWQKPTVEVVKILAEEFDVFGMSYAQTLPVDLVPLSKEFREGIATLKKLGYTQIVLVGHSAGGVLVRRFVELFPDAGVTKIIMVGTPHLGSGWTNFPARFIPKQQSRFIESLSESYRIEATKCAPPLSEKLEACCVVCKLPRLKSDTIVGLRSQWPEDLQNQGIPVILAQCNHFEAMTSLEIAKTIAEAAKNRVIRWNKDDTDRARKVLFGEK